MIIKKGCMFSISLKNWLEATQRILLEYGEVVIMLG